MGERAKPPPEPDEPAEWDRPEPVEDAANAGQGLVEYALGIFLMGIMILVILQLVGPKLGSIFSIVTRMG